MLALVLTFDSFPCAALGCYGNEWIDTPHFDRLAAEGFVCDAKLPSTVQDDRADAMDCLAALTRSGVWSRLISEFDARRQPTWSGSDILTVSGRRGADVPPREWPFAQLMHAARERLRDTSAARELLWLHSVGIPLPCEVPADVEALYVDEFADRGIDWTKLTRDERLRHPAVQAAYASCLDHFLGELLTDIEPIAATRPVLIAISSVYGGHWRTIPRRSPLPAEKEAQWLRAPSLWWTSQGGRFIVPGRSPALVQSHDIGPTLAEWFEAGMEGPGESLWPLFDGVIHRVREYAAIEGGVLWTEEDVTIWPVTPQPEQEFDAGEVHHYLWPEDQWFANDVASTSPDAVIERRSQWPSSGLESRL